MVLLGGIVLWLRPTSQPLIQNRKSKIENSSPLQPAYDLYNAGKYQQAEAQAEWYVQERKERTDLTGRKEALQARLVMAFGAARRKDFTLARQRFENLREAASALPDRGALPRTDGQPKPTLEEIGAFQSAVCTGVLEGPKAAEAAYKQFLCKYPTSVLIHGSVKRIARLHGGDIPKEAEKLWHQAVAQQERSARAEQRAMSLCGPQVLAELLRRQGKSADVETLAREMRTDHNGTSLLALASAARKRGWKARGLQLNHAALLQQPLPLITLLAPGHFVLVERVTPAEIITFDPNANGLGKPGTKTYPLPQWQQLWSGNTLALR